MEVPLDLVALALAKPDSPSDEAVPTVQYHHSSSQYWTLSNVMEFPFDSSPLEYRLSPFDMKRLPLDPNIRSEDSENLTSSRWAIKDFPAIVDLISRAGLEIGIDFSNIPTMWRWSCGVLL